MILVFVLLLPMALSPAAATATWDYSNTNWTMEYPHCGGSGQSPINIDSDTLIAADYSSFRMSLGYGVMQAGVIQNNGHTLKFSVDESTGAAISGGPLETKYTLTQLHFHWGSQPGQGSEHTID